MGQEIFRYKISETNGLIPEVEGLARGDYDAQAVQYDKLISNGLYNRLMWGNSPKNYTDFCRQALKSSKEGIIADIGCGTLSFTYKAYAEFTGSKIFLCDLSNEMLKQGKKRIEQLNGIKPNIAFLRSDALDMPFKQESIQTIFSFGIFHIFQNPSKLIQEIVRILKPEGQVYLTSLCTDRKFSKKYLHLLYKKGHVAQVLSSSMIKTIIEENGIKITELKVKGGMVYISGIKDTSS